MRTTAAVLLARLLRSDMVGGELVLDSWVGQRAQTNCILPGEERGDEPCNGSRLNYPCGMQRSS